MTNGGEASGAVLDGPQAAIPLLATEIPDRDGVPLDDLAGLDPRTLGRLLPSGRQSDSGFNSSI
ncbi:hypothetical protein ACIPSE_20615 [Streptomyces sp. NPDC090106]|uniref:hypothetical protein n=1 Tax=Streptomyces sp. NPDC090106 TaxID=3365946 RepID=UPI003808367B